MAACRIFDPTWPNAAFTPGRWVLRSAVFRAILALHVQAEAARCSSLTEIARRLPDDYEQCLDVVEETFARYPPPRTDRRA